MRFTFTNKFNTYLKFLSEQFVVYIIVDVTKKKISLKLMQKNYFQACYDNSDICLDGF